MKLTRIVAYNYKSLKRLEMQPEQFGIVVGSNAAGKSNLADCIDFISEVYRYGAELAVSRKGGYDNIAFHRIRRSKRAVGIHIELEFQAIRRLREPGAPRRDARYRAEHFFSFRTSSEAIKAPFMIAREVLRLAVEEEGAWQHLLSVRRVEDQINVTFTEENDLELPLRAASADLRRELIGALAMDWLSKGELLVGNTDLVITPMRSFIAPFRVMAGALSSMRVFQLHPNSSREFGVPTPGVELERGGRNLPAVVDMLKRQHSVHWGSVIETMRTILPGLVDIDVDYTGARTLQLLFRESGFGRPWNANEVSDGTIQTLAMLTAIHDPRVSMLVLEEPETSVHPWILRHIVDACIEAASEKPVLLTTHSPVLVNHVRPDQVWVMWRREGESRIRRLTDLDPMVMGMWESGEVATFDVLDGGLLGESIPPAPEAEGELETPEEGN